MLTVKPDIESQIDVRNDGVAVDHSHDLGPVCVEPAIG